MRRRAFIALAGAAAWSLRARAQQPGRPYRIGFLGLSTEGGLPRQTAAFRAALSDLGYREGRDIVIEARWAGGRYEVLPALAGELIGLKVDVILTHGTPGVLAAKQATATVPIVMAAVGDALASGLVSNLAHPGGNVTGSTFFNPELVAKRLELLKEAIPDLIRVGLLLNPANRMNEPVLSEAGAMARSLKLELRPFPVRAPAEFEEAFSTMRSESARALAVIDDAVLLANAPALAAAALRHRLPSCGWLDYAFAGGLLAYGVNSAEMWSRAAVFVDKILKGTKPGDLPVERATKFEVVINLKTAKALGLTIPPTLLARAEEVIE
jgi:putative ABC transport system substrate-binding protein